MGGLYWFSFPSFCVCEGGFFSFVFCLGLLLELLLCVAQLEWSVLGIVIWIQAQYHKLLDWQVMSFQRVHSRFLQVQKT